MLSVNSTGVGKGQPFLNRRAHYLAGRQPLRCRSIGCISSRFLCSGGHLCRNRHGGHALPDVGCSALCEVLPSKSGEKGGETPPPLVCAHVNLRLRTIGVHICLVFRLSTHCFTTSSQDRIRLSPMQRTLSYIEDSNLSCAAQVCRWISTICTPARTHLSGQDLRGEACRQRRDRQGRLGR